MVGAGLPDDLNAERQSLAVEAERHLRHG